MGMNTGMGVFMLMYSLSVVAIIIYLLVLATWFVKAHQRSARALEKIADKFDANRP